MKLPLQIKSKFILQIDWPLFGQQPRRGQNPVIQGESVCPSIPLQVRTSVRLYVHPPVPHPQGLVSFGAQIQTVWPKSKQNSPNPSKIIKIWLENLNSGLSSFILAPLTQILASDTQILASKTYILAFETQILTSGTKILISETQILSCSSLNLTYKLLKKGKGTIIHILPFVISPCYSMGI